MRTKVQSSATCFVFDFFLNFSLKVFINFVQVRNVCGPILNQMGCIKPREENKAHRNPGKFNSLYYLPKKPS